MAKANPKQDTLNFLEFCRDMYVDSIDECKKYKDAGAKKELRQHRVTLRKVDHCIAWVKEQQ
jgi:hypothetical protein